VYTALCIIAAQRGGVDTFTVSHEELKDWGGWKTTQRLGILLFILIELGALLVHENPARDRTAHTYQLMPLECEGVDDE